MSSENTTVQVVSDSSTGSIWEVAARQGISVNEGGPKIGGLHSGGVINEPHADRGPYRPQAANLGAGVTAMRDGASVTGGPLLPTDVLTFPGVGQVTYQEALDYGLITRDANGGQRVKSEQELAQAEEQAAQREQEQAERDAKASKGEPLDEQSGAWLREAVSTPERQDATFNLGSDLVHGDGEVSDEMVNEWASAQGIEPSEAKGRVTHVATAYQDEAVRAAAKEAGVPEEVAHQVLWDMRGSTDVRRVMMDHFQTGKPAGYGQFVLEHVASQGDTPEGRAAILAANPGLRVENDTVVVRLPDGTETSWANAVLSRKMTLTQ